MCKHPHTQSETNTNNTQTCSSDLYKDNLRGLLFISNLGVLVIRKA